MSKCAGCGGRFWSWEKRVIVSTNGSPMHALCAGTYFRGYSAGRHDGINEQLAKVVELKNQLRKIIRGNYAVEEHATCPSPSTQ